MAERAHSPGFITHHELDRLAGTARTRQRWYQRGLLPEPAWVRADRARLGLFPEFVLGSVLLGADAAARRSDAETELLHCSRSLAEQLCASASFRAIAVAAQLVLAESDAADAPWDLDHFVGQLGNHAAFPLAAWRSEVATAELELEAMGYRVARLMAEVRGVDRNEVLVNVDAGLVRYPVDELGWVPKAGRPIIIDHIEVGARGRDFLLPRLVLDPDVPGVSEGNPMKAVLHPVMGMASHASPSKLVPISRASGRLDAFAGGAVKPVPAFNIGRRQVNWREQFNRGYMGPELTSDTPIRKAGHIEVYSRKLERPIFRSIAAVT